MVHPGTNPSPTPQEARSPETEPPRPAQTGEEFRRVVAAYPKNPMEFYGQVLYGRGALGKEARRAVCLALKDLAIIVSVARDPEGTLSMRAATPPPEGGAADDGEAAHTGLAPG